jgi:predicted dehydrogenase
MARKFRIGFIGAGPTTKAHIRAFSDIPDVTVCGIYNRTYEKAMNVAHEYSISHCFKELDDLYSLGKPDLVVISVYESAKLDIFRKCIPYGVPILAEKPIALNFEESLEVLKLSQKHQCKIWIGLNRRSYSSTRFALNYFKEKSSSKRIIEIADQQDLTMAKKLGHSDIVLKNWMYANSIHLIDYFTIFARGDVEAVTLLNAWTPDHPTFVCAHLKFSSGDIGIYKAYWNAPGAWTCSISDFETIIELRPLEQAKYQKAGEREWNPVSKDEWDNRFKPGFRFQAQQAINALDSKDFILADIQSALQSTSLIAKIYS